MKKVAATSGQSVSFAAFLVEGSAREGNWAGRDKELNLLSRPPKAALALSQSRASGASSQNAGYGKIFPMQEKCVLSAKIFFEARATTNQTSRPRAFGARRGIIENKAGAPRLRSG